MTILAPRAGGCTPASVSEATLRNYVGRPGVTITAYEGPKHEVCVLTVSGPKTEEDLLAIIDQAVPPASRGLALGSMSQCMGICRNTRNYEKLTISSTVLFDGKLASPAATVTFKSKSCAGFKVPTAGKTN